MSADPQHGREHVEDAMRDGRLVFAVIGRRYVDMNRSLATSSPSSVNSPAPSGFVCFAPAVWLSLGEFDREASVADW